MCSLLLLLQNEEAGDKYRSRQLTTASSQKKISLTGTNRLITPGISVTLDIRHFHVRSLVIQTTVHQTGITHFPDISVAHRFLSRVLSRLSVLFLSCPDLNLLSVSFWASVYDVRQYGIAISFVLRWMKIHFIASYHPALCLWIFRSHVRQAVVFLDFFL